jgi:hypothetical protein
MLKRWEYWMLTLPALVAAVLVAVNMSLFTANRSAQAEISSRAQYIQQSAQLEPLYREIVKALADLSVRNNDGQLRELLTKQGITVSANPPAAAAPAVEPRKGGK